MSDESTRDARASWVRGLRQPGAWLCLTLVVGGLVGCSQPKPASLGGGNIARPSTGPGARLDKPLPKFEVLAARYNERVRGLGALRTPIGLLIDSEDEDGKRTRDQVEGNLSLVQPRYVVMRLDKVGQTLFQLGSNPEQYWWIDLSGDERVALVGTHTKARPDTAARFGVPVHPLDLLEVLAITPLQTEGARPGMRWSPDGRQVILTLPGRWAGRRLWVTPETGEATRVELLNTRGDVEVRARLEKYQIAAIRGDTITQPRMATKLYIEVPRNRVNVEMNIVEPENPGDRVRMTAFDLERQKDNLGVQRVVDLDAPPPKAAPTALPPAAKPPGVTAPSTKPIPASPPAVGPSRNPAAPGAASPSTRPGTAPLPAPGARGQPPRPSELPTPRERVPGDRP